MIQRRSRFLLLLLSVLALISCSTKAKPAAPHSAAEPAVAPALSGTAAGVVVKVGAQPEGIVYDTVTGLVAVAVRNPDRLVLLDGRTMRISKVIALAGHARHLQLAAPGGPVVVPEEDRNQLALVSLTGAPTLLIKTGTSPHDAAAVPGGYAAGDEFGSSITFIRRDKGAQTVGGVEQPGGVIALGATIAVVDVKGYTLTTYRVSDGQQLATVQAGAGPTHGVRISSGDVVVADTRGDELLSYSMNPLAKRAELATPGSPYGLAADSEQPLVWVTLTGRNQVVGLRVEAGRLTEVARLDTVQQPNTIAVAPGSHSIWIAGNKAGVVQRLSR